MKEEEEEEEEEEKVRRGKRRKRLEKRKKRKLSPSLSPLTDPSARVPLQLPYPVPRLRERLPVANVEDDGGGGCPAVVERGQRGVPLLARGVPDLELAAPSIAQGGSVPEIGSPDGDLRSRVEAAADVAEHEAGLAHALVGEVVLLFWELGATEGREERRG